MPVVVRRLFVAAATAAVLTGLLYLLSRRAGTAWWDDRVLEAIGARVRHWRLQESARGLRGVFGPGPYVLCVSLLVGSVLWRRRPALAALAFGMLLGANLSTWALQQRLGVQRTVAVLDEPPWMTYWPSGHTTAAVALAIAAWLVSAPRWRPFVAVAATVVAALAALTNLVVRVHVPSDVAGGVGVAVTWGLVAVAVQRARPERLTPR